MMATSGYTPGLGVVHLLRPWRKRHGSVAGRWVIGLARASICCRAGLARAVSVGTDGKGLLSLWRGNSGLNLGRSLGSREARFAMAESKAMNAVLEKRDRLLASERFLALQALRGNQEPGCFERLVVATLAPSKGLEDVLKRIPEIYDRIAEGVKDIQEGMPAQRNTKFKCSNPLCSNDDQNDFQPSRDGSVACRKCGECLSDFMIHEGAEFREFADQESRSHHGPALNPFYSASYQLGTQFRGLKGGKRSTGKETDFSISNIGKETAGTRVEYKDDQKGKAFKLMAEHGANLRLHDLVLQKAKGLFASYRDVLDRLYDFEAVVAACVVAAHLEVLLEEGHKEEEPTFQCPACGERFSTKRDADYHCAHRRAASGSVDRLANRSGGSNNNLQGNGDEDAVEVHKLGLEGVRALLQSWDAGGGLVQEIQGVCEGLRAQMCAGQSGSSSSSSEDEKDGADGLLGLGRRRSQHTAWQLLNMANLRTLTRWCGGNQEVAKEFFGHLQTLKKRKLEKDRLAEEEENDRKRRREHKDSDPFAWTR